LRRLAGKSDIPSQALLDRADCSLEALLNEAELIQELKSLNSRL